MSFHDRAFPLWIACKPLAFAIALLGMAAGCGTESPASPSDPVSTSGEAEQAAPHTGTGGAAEAASQSLVAPPSNAVACTGPAQCASGFCVDGYCCDTACTGTCQACSALKKGSGVDGTCGNIAANTNPDNECVNGKCGGDGVCKSYNGIACASTATCLSGYCVDGLCCGGACTGTCQACSVAKKGGGVEGQCANIKVATDPDNECSSGDCNGSGACTVPSNQANGYSCTGPSQCASGYCVDGFCCGGACTGTCYACSAAKKGGGSNGSCGLIAANTDPDNECSAGDCNGSGACPVVAGTGVNGTACTTGVSCVSGFCADGVCCDTACTESCKACTATKKGSGVNGTCGNIAANTNPDNECVSGKCSGSGACFYYNGVACTATSQCMSSYCVDGYCCGGACTGSCYACSAAKKGSGINGSCGLVAANTDPDNECAASDCNGSGACSAAASNGTACTTGASCASGFCTDGVCCDTACTGTCQACTATKKGSGVNGTCGNIKYDTNPDNECVGGKCSGSGTCQYYNGIECTVAANCLSNYCVDGYCCGNICTGTCYACSAAKKGSGTNGSCGLIAVNTDPDNECGGDCNGSGACALGGNGAACTAGSECASGFCVDGVCCDSACAGTCNACTAAKKGSGTNGTCGAIAVNTDPDSECGSGGCDGISGCFGASNGSACTADAHCLSGHCIDGVCCDTPCAGTCMACDVTGSLGTCSNVPLGQTDLNAVPPCTDVCDGQASCKSNSGAACTSGIQCLSRVCQNKVCAPVTPPGPLAWATSLSDAINGGTYNMQVMSFDSTGNINTSGTKNGYMVLGGVTLSVCCWKAGMGVSFNASGHTTGIGDWWLDDPNNTYSSANSRIRYENASTSKHFWHMGTGHSTTTGVSTPLWSRSFYQTSVGIRSGDGGHVLLGASIFADDQHKINPVDFGDGNLVTGSRLVKYGPTGTVEFNLPSGTLDPYDIIGPNGDFYDFSRASGLISIAKQDGMGNPLWTKTYTATVASGATAALAQAFDESGNILLAFNFNGTADLGNGAMTATGIHDLGLAKLDEDGNALWSQHFGTATFDLQSVDMDPTGTADMVVRGTFAGAGDFGGGTFTTSPFLAKFDATGTLAWQAPGPTGTFMVRGNASGAVFIASSSPSGDFGWGTLGAPGIVLAKYGPCANPANCRPNGSTCGMNTQCDSGFCVDGVCCDSACTGFCQACTASKKGQDSDGACGPIASTADPDNECANGACSGTGLCAQVNGMVCSAPGECLSGNCVDGYCCGGACVGMCQACSAAKKGGGANGGCGNIVSGMDPDDECGTGTCNGSSACSQASNGITCTAGSQCASGFCADGVCCNSACTGTCQACSAAKKGSGTNGTCGNIAAFADPDSECANGTCNGSGACVLGANGNSCSGTGDCVSWNCVDGVCCDTACTGTCQACSAAKKGGGANGTCGNIAYETDPDDECTTGKCSGSGTCQKDTGSACSFASNCLSGYCVDSVCCEASCSGLCQSCSAAKKGSGYDGLCGTIPTGTDPDSECAAECNGAAACVPAANGASCPDGSQCASGFCVDGVCCDAACAGTCEACTTAKKGSGSNGQCGPIGAGKDPDNECVAACDGTGTCALPPVLLADGSACTAGSQCTSAYCIDGVCCNTACDETCKACNLTGLAGTCSETSPGRCSVCSGVLGLPGLPKVVPGGGHVAVVDLNGDGILDIASTDYHNNRVSVVLGIGNGTFHPNGTFATGTKPISIAAADFNGDGTKDLVVVNSGEPSISVFFNPGDAVFAPKVDYATPVEASAVVVGDFNGDGKADMATSNYGTNPNLGNSVSAWLGDGTGAFAPRVDSSFTGLSPTTITAADLTGDGLADLAVPSRSYSDASIWILRGLGTGSFEYLKQYPAVLPGPFLEPQDAEVVAADMNGDGRIDLAMAVRFGQVNLGRWVVLYNLGNGTFGNRVETHMTGEPHDILAADLDGDGLIDIASSTAIPNPRGVNVLRNGGSGTFTNTFYQVELYSPSVAAGDVNADGLEDLVLGGDSSSVVLLNQGNGTFHDESTTATWNTLTDLNGDGKLDVVLIRSGNSGYTLSAHINQGNGTFGAKTDYGAVWLSSLVSVVDLNGDGKPDLVHRNNTTVSIRLNNGSGTFGAVTDYTMGGLNDYPYLSLLNMVDVSGDGKPDIVDMSQTSDLVSVRLNNGNGTFAAAIDYVVGDSPESIQIVDLTGDGKRDIAVTNRASNTISVLINNGGGTFAAKVDHPTGPNPGRMVAADVNADNIVDLVLRTDDASNLTNIDFALNQGNGTFALTNFLTGQSSSNFLMQDLSSDGKADFAIQSGINPNSAITVRLQQGSGSFGTPVVYSGPVFGQLTAIDVDGNGKPDIRSISGDFPYSVVLFNQGSGTFDSAVGYASSCTAFADLNGDGLQDCIRTDDTNVFVRLGTCTP